MPGGSLTLHVALDDWIREGLIGRKFNLKQTRIISLVGM